MKKKLTTVLLFTLLTAIITVNVAEYKDSICFTAPNGQECQYYHQWNGSPESTNGGDITWYEYTLMTGEATELYVFEEIAYFNHLTNEGVKILINDGFLVSYIDDFKSLGRLPQDFVYSPTKSDYRKQAELYIQLETGTTTPDTNTNTGNTDNNNAGSNNQGGSTTTTPTTNNNTTTVTVDESVSGAYIVIKAETATYSNHDTSSKKTTLILEEEVSVYGLTSNGFYKINKDGVVQYVKKENLVSKVSYDAAWSETSRTDATCKAEGSVTYTNDYTHTTKTETLAKLEHDFEVMEYEKQTCTAEGYEKKVCKLCNSEVEETLPKLGHTEGEIKTVKKASLFFNGKTESRCLTCDKVITTKTIPSTVPLIPVLCVVVAGIGAVAGVVVYKKKNKQADREI